MTKNDTVSRILEESCQVLTLGISGTRKILRQTPLNSAEQK